MHSLPSIRDDLFEALAESAPDAIVTIDEHSTILFANSAVTRIFGYKSDELIGESLQLLIPERLRAAHAAGIARYMSSGERKIPWTGVALPALTREGKELPVEISFGELTDSDGRRIFSGFIRDVSERARYQAELEVARQEAEAALRDVRSLHAITDSALAKGDYEMMLRELLQRMRAELSVDSATLLLLDADKNQLVVRATEGLDREALEGLPVPVGFGIAGRVAASGERLLIEDITTFPDVHPLLAAATASLAAVPIMMENEVIGVVHVGTRNTRAFSERDVRLLEVVADRMSGVVARTRLYETERRARNDLRKLNDELAQRAVEERALRTIAQRIAAAVSIAEVMQRTAEGALDVSQSIGAFVEQVDADGELVEVVATAGEKTPPVGTRVTFPGSLTEDIIRSREPSFFDCLDNVGASMVPHLTRHCADCPILVLPLLTETTTLGALVLVSPFASDQHDEGVVNRSRTLSDVASLALQRLMALAESDRRRAEAEAAVKSRDEVLSIVSHDLRNPVSTVAMSAQLLKDTSIPLTPAQRDQTLDVVLRSAHRMNRLIEDLLDVVRIEGARFTVNCRCESPSSLAKEACESFRPIVTAKAIRLECEPGVAIPKVHVDRDRVLQVLSNFLNNATKFTPPEGVIRLEVSVSSGEVRFTVTDSGPGIAEADRPNVFSRFWQAKRTAHLGAGLGLAIAKGIADAHKGRVWVESVVGQGSTFGFAVPVSARCADA